MHSMSYIVYYLHLFTSCHGFFTAVIIGFEMEEYTVFESNGVVTLVVSVMEGNIKTRITASLSTINGSALGRFTVLFFVQNARCDMMNLV